MSWCSIKTLSWVRSLELLGRTFVSKRRSERSRRWGSGGEIYEGELIWKLNWRRVAEYWWWVMVSKHWLEVEPMECNGEAQERKQRWILVTGGAGYIGTHTVLQLLMEGYCVVIIDNLDNSCEEALHRVRKLAGEFGENLKFVKVYSLAVQLRFVVRL